VKSPHPDAPTITVHVPMTFTVRGGRKAVIFDAVEAPAQRRIDNALLKALARAHRWRKMIESGEYSSITELALAQNVNPILRLSSVATDPTGASARYLYPRWTSF
jgi:hypothetical protein